MFLHKNTIIVILLLLSLILVNNHIKADNNMKEVSDMAERQVKVPEKIDRIVAVGPGTLRQPRRSRVDFQ